MARSRRKQGSRGRRVKVKDPTTGLNVKDKYGRPKTRALVVPVSYATQKRWRAEEAFWAEVRAAREAEARLEAEAEYLKSISAA